MRLFRRFHRYVIHWLFADYARPIEVVSFWAMFGFGLKIMLEPDVLDDKMYTGFVATGLSMWVYFPLALVVLSAIAMHLPVNRFKTDLRVLTLAGSTFFWISTAGTFAIGDAPSTAVYTYLAIAFGCFLSGGYLAWKAN